MESGEEKMFFNLDIPREKNYYYGVPKKKLEEDENLMDTIQLNLKSNIQHDKMKTTYSVYSTDYDKLIAYCEKNNLKLSEVHISDLKRFSKLIEKDIYQFISISSSVDSKKSYGGTSKTNVKKMIAKSKKILAKI